MQLGESYLLPAGSLLRRSLEESADGVQVELVVQQPLQGHEERRRRHALRHAGACSTRPQQSAPPQLQPLSAGQPLSLSQRPRVQVQLEMYGDHLHHAFGGAHCSTILYLR